MTQLYKIVQLCIFTTLLEFASSETFSNPTEECEVPGVQNSFDGLRIRGHELNVRIRQFPFMASYGYLKAPSLTDWSNKCAASVLSKKTLMTAAHCLRGHYSSKHQYQILVGQAILNSDNYDANRQQLNISKVELHPLYDNISSYYDIGIIHTTEEIDFNEDVKPICLPNQPNSDVNFLASRPTHMAGWGQVDQANARRDEIALRQISLTTFDQDYCNDRYDISGNSPDAQNRQKFLPSMFSEATICAGSVVQNIGSCKGDSGAPLIEYLSSSKPPVMVVRGVLHGCIGICCSAKYPSVFANLGDKEIWNFVQEKAIKINVDHTGKNQKQVVNETGTNVTGIVIGTIFSIFLLGTFFFVYIRYCKTPEILTRV